jgi:hypothetical protein
MPFSRIVNNVGIGSVEATALNLTTTVAAFQGSPFTQALVDAYRRGFTFMGNNYVGQGTTTAALHGAVVGCSESLSAKGFPIKLTIAVSGFQEIQGTTGAAITAVATQRPPFQNRGRVVQGTTTPALPMLRMTRGRITEVYNTDRCVVLF